MTPPRVAVLTPCYGHARYLPAMLDGLLRQDMEEWECAVVVDGPDPDAVAVAAEYALADDRITYIVLDERGGPARARNLAAVMTEAPWLLPFDADDIPGPWYLRHLLDMVQGHQWEPAMPPFPVAYTAATVMQEDGRAHTFRYPPFDPHSFVDRFQIPNATLHPRAMHVALGGWDEGWTDGAEDWHYWTRAVAQGWLRPCNSAEAHWTYREHSGSRHSRVGHANWPRHQAVLRRILQGRG